MSDEVEVEAEVGTSRRNGVLAPFVALGVAVVMIGLVVLLIGADPNGSGVQDANTPLMDNPAPEAVGELGDGTPFDLSRRKGSWVVLNFFQSDCVPCIREHPELIKFVDQQRALDQGTEFYSVVFGDTKDRVERFFEERGGDWPVVFSDGDGMPASFGVNLVPETWIVDPQGIVRFRAISEVSADTLSAILQQLQRAPR
jgi:cytochrome c biogenesis protein CcmG/thiol:disulfide interchange protein DsbE